MGRQPSANAEQVIEALRKSRTHREAAVLLGIHETTLSRLKRRYRITELTDYEVREAA